MFRLYHSNDLELLKELLLEQIKQDPMPVFEPEAILVQSQGMAHWLKLQLAQGLGVAAQIDFPLPSSFMWQVFNRLKPELPERSSFDKQLMVWKLMRLLPILAQQDECAAIADYLETVGADYAPLKCYQLAHAIADVFDQYLLYRPHWLLDWEQGSNLLDGQALTTHTWQPFVWRALVTESARLGHSLEHRAHVQLQLPTLVQQHPQAFQQLPKRLFVFGIATLPKAHWQVLQAIATHMDVHFFLLNPCNEFWSDIVTNRQQLQQLKQRQGSALTDLGNPLLASWGRLGRDFLTLVQNESVALQEFELFYHDPARPATLLSALQQDIFTLHNRQQAAFSPDALVHSQFKQGIALDDGSVRIVSAHSPLREVQRLYDQILQWLDADPQLKPRDIVVMVPDINQYAPYIDAVFASHKASTNDGHTYRIPWAIADQAIAQENPIIIGFLSLLALPDSRFLTTDVQDWLEVAAIARRFGLDRDDIEQVRKWLALAAIRWGLDGAQREQLGLPRFEQNSWRKGLKQLLLGALLPTIDGGYQDDYPVFAAEGNETERLGKLMQFIDTLEYFRTQLQQPQRSVAGWVELLNQLLDAFYLADADELSSVQSLRQAVVQWQGDLQDAGFNGSLPVAVVAAWFNDQLGQQTGWQRFLAGPVNFCSLMPMRSIPFKAVCLLGMNDNDYPRRTTPVGFDLIAQHPQAGDRSRREDDRYLFLEAVSSAQDFLYISYRGRDIRENSVQQPSVLVAELRDYLADSFCLNNDLALAHRVSRALFLAWLVEELPLQPYSERSFAQINTRAVPSYQHLWAGVAQVTSPSQLAPRDWVEQPLALPAELSQTSLNWRDLISALTHPPKFFMQRRLQVNLDADWQQQEVNEPFATDNLTLYGLKQQWLEQVQAHPELLQQHEAEALHFSVQQQALGRLPVNQMGQHWGQQIAADLQPLLCSLQPLLAYPIENCSLTLTVAGTELMGELQHAYRADPNANCGSLVFHRVGKLRGQDVLQAWLQLLLASCASPTPITHALLVTLEKEGVLHTQLNAPTPDLAWLQLQQALTWYWRCWQQPIAHYPNTLWLLIEGFAAIAANPKLTTDDQRRMKKEALVATCLDQEFGELVDNYSQRCFAGFIHQLADNYESWLGEYAPLLACARQHLTSELQDATP